MKKSILLAAILLVGCDGKEEQTPQLITPLVIEFKFETGITYREVECLAKNIYFEARGERMQGQVAVAHVAINRKTDKRFPNTICEVVYQGEISNWFLTEQNRIVPLINRCQFSWWCDGKSDEPKDMWAWGRAMDVAAGVINDTYKDPTEGALWYHNLDVDPDWNQQLASTGQIENHLFYR